MSNTLKPRKIAAILQTKFSDSFGVSSSQGKVMEFPDQAKVKKKSRNFRFRSAKNQMMAQFANTYICNSVSVS